MSEEGRGESSDSSEDVQVDLADIPSVLPVLPTRDIVAYPTVMLSLYIGREASKAAIEHAHDNEKLLFVVAQEDPNEEEPSPKSLFQVGVICRIARIIRLPDSQHKVLLHGLERSRASAYAMKDGYITAEHEIIPVPEVVELTAEDELLMNRIRENLQVLAEYEQVPEEMLLVAEEVDEPGVLADLVAAQYQVDLDAAQAMLEEVNGSVRLKRCDEIITNELNQLLVSENIQQRARDELTKDQRKYFLREQIKQIQIELGEEPGSSEDLSELKSALEEAGLPELAGKEADKQLSRLERMQPESSEFALLRTYLEWLSDLPWSKRSEESLDLAEASEILNEDHYGLEKVKDRILEFLSVRKLKETSKGPILCFVGPPGVGKTSLGKSVARSLGREFFRMSLGGVRDEAEIRGHRRTYVGALPGRIIQGLKQVGTKNPVFVLDELDKIGADFRGDPASALLEVLDPQQNKAFQDHYLNLPFDLSEVLFLATANTLDTIPEALLDRLEVIRISGYTTEEKVRIAERHLLPRQLEENGLANKKLGFDQAAMRHLIQRYTRESGVRNLEREIGSVLRKVARLLAEGKSIPTRIRTKFVGEALGATRYDDDFDEKVDAVGLVRGLAWTRVGGEIMPIEASLANGTGQLTLTGQLGDVMQESARAALFYARANAKALGLDEDFAKRNDFHVHCPGGAIPKDGPSAGIALATALVSALSDSPVSKDLAMTGEITLRGNVLAVGGIREKALAALRYGIRKVIIPFENIKDLEDIPKEQREKIKFVPVKHISEVLKISLKKPVRRKAKASKSKTARSKRVRSQ